MKIGLGGLSVASSCIRGGEIGSACGEATLGVSLRCADVQHERCGPRASGCRSAWSSRQGYRPTAPCLLDERTSEAGRAVLSLTDSTGSSKETDPNVAASWRHCQEGVSSVAKVMGQSEQVAAPAGLFAHPSSAVVPISSFLAWRCVMSTGNEIGIIPAIVVVFFAFLIAEPLAVFVFSVWGASWEVLMDWAYDFATWIGEL